MAQPNGPTGKGLINSDSFITVTPPPPAPVLTAKVIVPTDKKTGPPKPAYLGGNQSVIGGFGDSYYE